MLNAIFAGLIAVSVLYAAWAGRMAEVMRASIDSAISAVVDVLLPLLGLMALWLGLMRVLRDAGAMRAIARGLAPVMRRLFPDVPAEHPAMGAMIMNIAANVLGLGNAATPFGLKAMRELQTLNPHPGMATNSMALFLAINTSGVAVLPFGVINVRATLGSLDPAGILVPTVLATLCSTVVAVLVAKSVQGLPAFSTARYQAQAEPSERASIADGIPQLEEAEEIAAIERSWSPVGLAILAVALAAFLLLMVRYVWQQPADTSAREIVFSLLESWLLPFFIAGIVLVGMAKRVPVYESVIRGAREGFDIFVMIVPFLVAILVAVGMFRASGAMDLVAQALTGFTSLPPEGLMMAVVRPLSGSGAQGVMIEAMKANGPDSFTGYLVSVMSGSTETTFYVLAVYLGAVRVRIARHTVIPCLAADLTGFVAAFALCRWFFA